jgi:hypothetical protein
MVRLKPPVMGENQVCCLIKVLGDFSRFVWKTKLFQRPFSPANGNKLCTGWVGFVCLFFFVFTMKKDNASDFQLKKIK